MRDNLNCKSHNFIFCSATDSDLTEIVSLHLKCFPGFFLTRLGPRFLEYMYRSFIANEKDFLIVAILNESLAGFVAGTSDTISYPFNIIKKYPLIFSFCVIRFFIIHPIFIWNKIRSRLLSKKSEINFEPNSALLCSIAVSPDYRRSGLSYSLMNEFEATVKSSGLHKVYLTTDKINNDNVNEFYKKSGYKILTDFNQANARAMYLYEKSLS